MTSLATGTQIGAAPGRCVELPGAFAEHVGDPAVPSAPIHVMHVLHALHTGGMEYGVLKLVNGIDSRYVRSSICSTKPAGDLKYQLAPSVRLFELRRRDGNDVRLVLDLYRLFRRERPHVVHTHAWGTLVEGLVAARLARVPVVIHGEHGTLQLKWYQRRIQRHAWAAADQVLCVSSRLAERMTGTTGFDRARVRTIRNGVDFARFESANRDEARYSLGLDQAQFVVGTVGRLVPVKDQACLIDSVADVRRRGIDITTILAGDGPLRSALEARATAAGVAGCVRFLGQRADIERVLAALDVFVLSSVSEGLSNTILEAMAAGLPVVATHVGGADELVENGRTGLLVAPGCPRVLANAIAELAIDAPRRSTMASAGRARAEAEFGLSRMIANYTRLYIELAGKATARSATSTVRSNDASGRRNVREAH